MKTRSKALNEAYLDYGGTPPVRQPFESVKEFSERCFRRRSWITKLALMRMGVTREDAFRVVSDLNKTIRTQRSDFQLSLALLCLEDKYPELSFRELESRLSKARTRARRKR